MGEEDDSQGCDMVGRKRTHNKENNHSCSIKSHELIGVSDSKFNSEFDKSV